MLESNPSPQIESIEDALQQVLQNEWPDENGDYFLRTMLPKYVVALLKRG